MVADLELQFSVWGCKELDRTEQLSTAQLIPNKLIFPGEIPVSLFISGQLLFSSFINALHPYYTIIFLTLHIGFLVVHKTFFSNIRI